MTFLASPPTGPSIISPPSKKQSYFQPSSAMDMKSKDPDGTVPFAFAEVTESHVPIPEVKQRTPNLPPTRLTESLVR